MIIHGLVAVALLGAITHQTLPVWAPARARPGSFFGRFRAVQASSFTNAIVILYVVAALLGATVYLYFKVDIGPALERDHHWQAIGFFDLKEDFVSIGLGILPAYWVCWVRPTADEAGRTRAALTALLAFIVWWSFLVGHVLNNMTPHPAFRRFAFAYATTFAILYAVARAKGLVLFTFYPSLGIVMVGLHRSRDVVDPALEFLAPEMYWYGWTASAAAGALMVGLVAALLSDRWISRFWPIL